MKLNANFIWKVDVVGGGLLYKRTLNSTFDFSPHQAAVKYLHPDASE
jgi:hypothetical protein